jgi:hypothetical protein
MRHSSNPHSPHASVPDIPSIIDIFYYLIYPLPVSGSKRNRALNFRISELDRTCFDVDEQFDLFLLAHNRVRAPAEKGTSMGLDEVELLQGDVGLEERVLCKCLHGQRKICLEKQTFPKRSNGRPT